MKGWLDKYGKEINANEGRSSAPENWMGEGYSNVGRNYSPAWGGQFAMGGSMPGAVGFTYARTGGIPSNGPYAKKTKASAQTGETVSQDTATYQTLPEVVVNSTTDPDVEQAKQKMIDFYENRPSNLSGKKAIKNISRVEFKKGDPEALKKADYLAYSQQEGNRTPFIVYNPDLGAYEESGGNIDESLQHELSHVGFYKLPNLEKLKIHPVSPKEFARRWSFKNEGDKIVPISKGDAMYYTRPNEIYARRKGASDFFGLDMSKPVSDEEFNRMIKFRQALDPSLTEDQYQELIKKDPKLGEEVERLKATPGGNNILNFLNALPDDVKKYRNIFNEVTAVPGEQAPVAQNGMTYYQHGLDWKPKSISKNGSDIPKNQNAQYQVPSFNMPRAASESTATMLFDPVTKRMVSTATTGQKKEDVAASTKDMGKAKKFEIEEEKKRVAERKAAKAFNEGKSKTFTLPSGETKTLDQMDWRDKAYVAGKSLEGKGRFNEDKETWYDNYANPLNWITEAAGALGTAPYEARESKSNLPYLTAIGAPLITGAMGFDPLGSAIKTAEHPLISTIPSVIKNKAFAPYGEALFFGAADKAGAVATKIPGVNQLYKKAAENVAGQSASAFRNINSIKNIFKPAQHVYAGVIGVGEDHAVRQSGRNLVRNYIYGDTKGFTASNIPTEGLEKYAKKYGPLKTYQLDASNIGDVPMQFNRFLDENSHQLLKKGVINKDMAPYEKFEAVKDYVKNKGNISFGSEENRLGVDDIGGHMKFLRYEPSTDDIMMKTQDIWKFEPKAYNTRYGDANANRFFTNDPASLNKYLKAYSRNKQSSLMERAGKPFVLVDERPVTLKVNDYRNINTSKNVLQYSPEEYETLLKEASDYNFPENLTFSEKSRLPNITTKFKQKKGGVIKDDMGQWAHPGEITEIGSNQITMQGVPYPVLGVSDEGDTQMMYPEQEYKFKGKKVTEYPLNKKSTGGWLDKYN